MNGEDDRTSILDGYTDENNPIPAYYVIFIDFDKVDRVIEEFSKLDEVKQISTIINTNPYIFFITNFLNLKL